VCLPYECNTHVIGLRAYINIFTNLTKFRNIKEAVMIVTFIIRVSVYVNIINTNFNEIKATVTHA
jgi:hypothetical protein